MLFKRRKKLHLKHKIRNFLVPPKGLMRSFKYIWRRIWRINATPYAIAFGVAAGAFASCTPFLGFHIIMAAIIAYIFKANILASLLGTAIGNPISFPFIWIAIKNIGDFVLGNEPMMTPHVRLSKHLFSHGWQDIWMTLKPMMVGGLLLGLFVGGIFYLVVYRAVKLYQKKRLHKFN